MTIERRFCLSVDGLDFEAWTAGESEAAQLAAFDAVVAEARRLRLPGFTGVRIERWPDVLEQYRERFGLRRVRA